MYVCMYVCMYIYIYIYTYVLEKEPPIPTPHIFSKLVFLISNSPGVLHAPGVLHIPVNIMLCDAICYTIIYETPYYTIL